MLNNIGGYSVDKAKFALELTVGDAAQRAGDFEAAVANSVGPRQGRSYNVVSVKKGAADGTYLYIFDVWGEAAQDIDGLDFATWFPYLDRMDLKLPMKITDDGLFNLYQYLEEKLDDNHSIDYRKSPVRQKRGNRDSGGHSLALGSHKSDMRVHWTQRGEEDGYQEFQVKNERLETPKGASRYYLTGKGTHPEPIDWRFFAKTVLTGAKVETHKLIGLWDEDLKDILSGSMDNHAIVERKLSYIEASLAELPQSALFALYDALNERLFGVTSESDGTTEQEYNIDTHQDED